MMLSMAFWRNLTNLADSAVLLPLCVLMVLFLWLGQARQALLLLRAFAVFALSLSLLKLVFVACGEQWHAGFSSPSGHLGLGIFSYCTLCTLVTQDQRPRLQWLAWSVTVALLLGIAWSRWILGAHSPTELVLGGVVGVGGFLLFYLPYQRSRHPHLPLGPFLAIIGLTVVLSYGLISPAEKVLGGWALWLRHSGLLCSG